MEIEKVYELIDSLKSDIKKDINLFREDIKDEVKNSMDIHFRFQDQKLESIKQAWDESIKNQNDLDKRVTRLEYNYESLKKDQDNQGLRLSKLQELFEGFKIEIKADIEIIKKLITKGKLTPKLVISLIVSLLSAPAITLLIQALLKAIDWL